MTIFNGQLYLDCDGVLADFDETAYDLLGMNPRRYEKLFGASAFWSALMKYGSFFDLLRPTYDAYELLDAVRHLNPIILTGAPKELPTAKREKEAWVTRYFGQYNIPVVVCASKDKRNFCQPGDIIVDDWPKHQHLWEEAGGIWVDHRNTDFTLTKLTRMGVL